MAAPKPAALEADAPPHAAVAFSADELAFFEAGEEISTVPAAPVETFEDVPAPRRGFWERLLSR